MYEKNDVEEFDELRRLIFGEEEKALGDLSQRVIDPESRAIDVAEVLPLAIAIGTKRDDRLAESLQQPLDECIKLSVQRDPKSIADALFPIIGPAIRKSITETLKEFVQSVNQALEQGFSVRGLRWRWESWRTGTPFAKVVLKYTLDYRVEQAFLIHRHNGLLVGHAAINDIDLKDTDAVSGMLTVIQDFVRDSFPSATRDEELNMVDMGEHVLWVLRGPYAMLACVIWGIPPPQVREFLLSTLEGIHESYGRRLDVFSGDGSAFIGLNTTLAKCLLSKSKADPRENTAGPVGRRGSRSLRLSPPMIIASAAIVIVLGSWLIVSLLESRRVDSFIQELQTTPGIVVLTTAKEDGVRTVRGLRDSLSVSPEVLMRQVGLAVDALDLQWVPFQSLEPQIVEKRARSHFSVPQSIQVRLQGDTLRLLGSAPLSWTQRVKRARTMPAGVNNVDLSAVQPTEGGDLVYLRETLEQVPGIVVLDVDVEDERPVVRGLIDPLAPDPAGYAAAAGFPANGVRFELAAYQSLESALVLARARRHLSPPVTVQLDLIGSTLVISGWASSAWFRQAESWVEFNDAVDRIERSGLIVGTDSLLVEMRARLAPPTGVELFFDHDVLRVVGRGPWSWVSALSARLDEQRILPGYDLSGLVSAEFEQFRLLARMVDSLRVPFAHGTVIDPAAGATLRQLATTIREMARLDALMDLRMRVVIRGLAAPEEDRENGVHLRRRRAEVVQRLLSEHGVPAKLLEVAAHEPTSARADSYIDLRLAWLRVRYRVPRLSVTPH